MLCPSCPPDEATLELGAVDDERRLTEVGRELARLPKVSGSVDTSKVYVTQAVNEVLTKAEDEAKTLKCEIRAMHGDRCRLGNHNRGQPTRSDDSRDGSTKFSDDSRDDAIHLSCESIQCTRLKCLNGVLADH